MPGKKKTGSASKAPVVPKFGLDGARVFERRKHLKLSQMDLAMRLNAHGWKATPQVISRVENGHKDLVSGCVAAYARALECSSDFLLRLNEKP
jgi:transcriptional regulator with XRE-family HTH domain